MPYQPEIDDVYMNKYIKTLIKTKELNSDVEKMEFLSNVLINPNLKFYASSKDSAKNKDLNFRGVLEKHKK